MNRSHTIRDCIAYDVAIRFGMVRPVILFQALPPSHWSQVFVCVVAACRFTCFVHTPLSHAYNWIPYKYVLTPIHVYTIFLWRSLTSNTYQSKRCETNENTNGCNNTETISESLSVRFFFLVFHPCVCIYFLYIFFPSNTDFSHQSFLIMWM